MEDLLRSQIHESCKLALPEGLKDLMSDISREVLRAQPHNLYQFIASYLEALLEARETLTIACQLCSEVCECSCASIKPELYNELSKIGLDEEDIEKAIEIIEKHLYRNQKSGFVRLVSDSFGVHLQGVISRGARNTNPDKTILKEQSLLIKLSSKTSISEEQLPAVQRAVQNAFRRHYLEQRDLTLDHENKNNTEAAEAVHLTLELQKQNKTRETNITEDIFVETSEAEEIFVAPDFKRCVTTVSSTSLAGSFVPLPKFRPYCAHECNILSAIQEKDASHNKTTSSTTIERKLKNETDTKTKILKNDEKYKASLLFDDTSEENEVNIHESEDDYFETKTSREMKGNKVKISDDIERIGGKDDFVYLKDDYNDEMEMTGCSDDEVQEFIENSESEHETSASSIAETLPNDNDD